MAGAGEIGQEHYEERLGVEHVQVRTGRSLHPRKKIELIFLDFTGTLKNCGNFIFGVPPIPPKIEPNFSRFYGEIVEILFCMAGRGNGRAGQRDSRTAPEDDSTGRRARSSGRSVLFTHFGMFLVTVRIPKDAGR